MGNYVGNEPKFTSNARDHFAGDGSTVNFTLSAAPAGGNSLLVTVSGVPQVSGVSYFTSGTTLTFSAAPPTPQTGDTYNIEVIYLNRVGVVPSVSKIPPIARNTGTANAITGSYNPINTTFLDNTLLYVVLPATNTITTPTFAPDSMQPKTIVNSNGGALSVGQLTGTVLLRYDLSTDKWWVAYSPNLPFPISLGKYSEKTSAISSTGAVTIDLSGVYGVFVVTVAANTTYTFTGVSGTDLNSFVLIMVNDATPNRTVTFPASVKWSGGVIPPRTTTANAVDIWTFTTYNAGTTWIGSLAVKNAS